MNVTFLKPDYTEIDGIIDFSSFEKGLEILSKYKISFND